MFGLLSRSRSRTHPTPLPQRRTRLAVERLETRDYPAAPMFMSLSAMPLTGHTVEVTGSVSDTNPAADQVTLSGVLSGTVTPDANGTFTYMAPASSLGTISAVATNAQGETSGTMQTTLSSTAPSIQNLMVMPGSGRTVMISGQVSDPSPGGLTVTLSGVVNGTAVTNYDGTFNLTAQASGLGNITATTTDGWGLAAPPAQATITSAAPSIQMMVMPSSQRTVMITGRVFDESPGGLTVTLSGVVNGTVVTNYDGTFNLTAQASGLGNVTATTSDVWGLAAPPAQIAITANAPAITSFMASHMDGNTWTFSGHVVDGTASGLTMQFGGLTTLNNQTVTTDAAGNFSFTITLQNGESGLATVQTTDWWGLQSNQAQALVSLG